MEFCLGRKSSSLPCALLPVLHRCKETSPLKVPLLRNELPFLPVPPFLLCPPSPCGFPPLFRVTHQWPALFLVVWMES